MKAEATPLDQITKEDFIAYERVRKSGKVNMFDPRVQKLAKINRETHVGILRHYSALNAKWPDVRTPSTPAAS